jgi:hypothetical protein
MFRVLPALLLLPALAAAAPGSIRFHGKGTPPVPDPVQQITPPPVDRLEIRIDAPAVPADIGATDFTLEFWMRADPGENAAGACIAGVGGWRQGNLVFDRNIAGDGDYGEYGLSLFEDGLAFGVGVGPAGNTICGATDVDAVAGAWHHVAVTRRQATGELALFVDGKLDAVGAGPPGDASYRDDRPTSQDAIDPYLMIGGRKLGNEGNFPRLLRLPGRGTPLDRHPVHRRLLAAERRVRAGREHRGPLPLRRRRGARRLHRRRARFGDRPDGAQQRHLPVRHRAGAVVQCGDSTGARACTGDACVRCGNGVV